MSSHKRHEQNLRALCAQLHLDDGVDPREDKRGEAGNERKPDRKLRQLCKQVAQTLQLALGGLPQADELVGVSVWDVSPAPNAGRLRVVIAVPDPRRREEVAAIMWRHSGRLRSEVASAITRSRTPELTFEMIVEGGARG